MKKLLLATTVAASLTTAANATTYDVSSNITGLQLYVVGPETENLLAPGLSGYFTGFKFGGTATDANDDGIIDSANLTLTGEAGFTLSPSLKLTFNLGSGNFVAGSGTTFSSGTIQLDGYIDVNPDDDEGENPDFQWAPFSTIDASTTNLPFVAGQPGLLTTRDIYGNILTQPNTTAGLQLAPGTHALPGLWDGQIDGEGVNSGLNVMYLFGGYMEIFMQGTITLTPQAVPLPASVWLFGSALAGLVGTSRKRKTA